MASCEILTEVLPDEILSMLKNTPKGMMIVPFTNVTDIKEIVRQQIRKVQNDESDDRLIFVTKFPFGQFMFDFSNFETYQRGVAASCKSMYFDGHELLIMKITQDVDMDTTNVTLSPEQLNGDGVEAYVLKKLENEIELFRDETDLSKRSHWFRYGQSCHTSGEYGEKGRVPSRRQCELMLMPSHNLKDIRDSNDFQHEEWPCVVFETGPARSNDACREYLWFAADWWFRQSRGMVQVVFLLFFDRKNRRLDIEKVVYDGNSDSEEISFTDGIVEITQTDNGKTEVSGAPLVLGFREIAKSKISRDINCQLELDEGFLATLAERW